VLETVRKEEEKKPKRLGSVQPNFSSVWHTGLSGGAPDSVRCVRLVSDESAALGNRRRRTAKNHRTVWWCTGLSGDPTVASANGR
jgi:adenylylsulfate kinase-like enzyme